MGLSQAVVSDPLSIWYLTGYYTEPYERFLALYLGSTDTILFVNRLFPDAHGVCEHVVTFSDTDDPIPLLTARCDHTSPLRIDKDLAARWRLPLMDAGAAPQYRPHRVL
jgi:Xaa-Pro dipeptidase